MSSMYKVRRKLGQSPTLIYWPCVFATSILAFAARIPFNDAEDVTNARNNILIGARTDFWGGFAPWFFAIYDRSDWEIFYASLQGLLIFFGSLGILNYLLSKTNKSCLSNILFLSFLNHLVSLFVLSFSRDGALLSFSWFGIGCFLFSNKIQGYFRSMSLRVMSICFLVTGFSFRPWLSVSLGIMVILLRFVFSSRRSMFTFLNLMLLSAMILAPVVLDLSFKKFQNLESSFPEQQVMIMDATSMVCLSASSAVSESALDVLRKLPASKNVNRKVLCGQWYPQSWASPIFYGDLADGEKPALSMIPPNDFASYENFKSAWLNLLLTNLAAYVQVKVMLGSQFLLAGDSIFLDFHSWQGLLLLPLQTLNALRLVSIFPIMILLLWLSFRSRENGLKNIRKMAQLKLLTAFYLSFCAMSVISFIGDNQRYLFTGSILVILFSFLLELGNAE